MRFVELRQASTEGQAVCLACDAVQPRVALPDEGCVECGDSAVYSAELILRAASFVAGLLEDEEGDW